MAEGFQRDQTDPDARPRCTGGGKGALLGSLRAKYGKSRGKCFVLMVQGWDEGANVIQGCVTEKLKPERL